MGAHFALQNSFVSPETTTQLAWKKSRCPKRAQQIRLWMEFYQGEISPGWELNGFVKVSNYTTVGIESVKLLVKQRVDLIENGKTIYSSTSTIDRLPSFRVRGHHTETKQFQSCISKDALPTCDGSFIQVSHFLCANLKRLSFNPFSLLISSDLVLDYQPTQTHSLEPTVCIPM